jgi:hypothetical protein
VPAGRCREDPASAGLEPCRSSSRSSGWASAHADVAEGWTPLRHFLDVAVPEVPFPRVNSTEQFWKLVRGEPR